MSKIVEIQQTVPLGDYIVEKGDVIEFRIIHEKYAQDDEIGHYRISWWQ